MDLSMKQKLLTDREIKFVAAKGGGGRMGERRIGSLGLADANYCTEIR